jgi:small subunit ribosomal protein S8|tara:strand:- start:1369 stop:1758 length:390 start_codon:yes stop_codon:yes gene_type:complete
MSDPIADMLTRIRNGLARDKVSVSMPSSGVKEAIAAVLKEEGFIDGFSVTVADQKKELTVDLRYHQGEPAIEKMSRVSRPGRRQYCGATDMPSVNGGLGVVMISTSKGIMSDRQARRQGIGGEVICSIF